MHTVVILFLLILTVFLVIFDTSKKTTYFSLLRDVMLFFVLFAWIFMIFR